VLRSCELLIAYFGSPVESIKFEAAAKSPRSFASQALAISQKMAPPPDEGEFCSFVGTRRTAERISPLLHLLIEPLPEFWYHLDTELGEDQRAQFKRAYCHYVGMLGANICGPMWKRHRGLAPRGWRHVRAVR
jgi:hypothetical protein